MQVAGSPSQWPDRSHEIVESPTSLYPLLQRTTHVDPELYRVRDLCERLEDRPLAPRSPLPFSAIRASSSCSLYFC